VIFLEGHNIKFLSVKEYEIDFEKVRTINDIIEIMKGMNIKVYDNYGKFEKMKPFLKEVE